MSKLLHSRPIRTALLCLMLTSPAQATLLDEPDAWFLGLLHHVDKWYLSDRYHFEPDDDEIIPVHVNRLNVPQAENDRSRFYAIDFPEIQLYLVLKQSNYTIEELDLAVTNTAPKIISVKQYSDASPMPPGYQRRELSEDAADRILYEKRFKPADWSAEQLENLSLALTSLLRDKSPIPAGEQRFHVAPHSDYATSIHVFWETARKIIIFSSDADFNSDAYWQLLPLNTDIIDLDEDVVTTLLLVPGSNAYVTKAWAARIVYHCVVKGQPLRITVVER